MDETIFYEQPYDTTAEGGIIEAYLNRFLGIRVSGCVLQIDKGYAKIYTDNTPIRHVYIRDNKGRRVDVTFQVGKIFAPTDGWQGGGYGLTYASGYGQLQGVLPAHIDEEFTRALSTNVALPQDIALAMRRMGEILTDREGSRPDIEAQSQELGSTEWIPPMYRATIPTDIRGMLMNHRKVAL